ncbi:CotH kinase family protein [Lachnoclostridium sp. MSJ-17]|uniref:CotH kinase family protein n=1 Tax=Lachnoclostridium sp. MSJ-17 TaxID=2841516 RepID=UPI001C106444|nr:CotH kinase family protein [Lachnoclostridium sp. MSJ-17]MBU5462533.1 CotH kinase family protein [Lachnoclostridium sp. MSJ-17]
MKKLIAALLCLALLIPMSAGFSVYAAEQENIPVVPVEVPKLEIKTENGNGTSLQKEDGYTGANIAVSENGASVLEKDIVIKVRGNSTAMTAKKSFTFKFDKKQDLFGMGKSKKWVLLANAFDPTLLRSYVAFDLAQELGIEYTSRQKIVELWLDGKFRGCYTLMTPVKATLDTDGDSDFMLEYERLRVDEGTTYITSNGLRFGISDPDEPEDSQVEYISKKLDELSGVIKNGDREAIESAVDIPSFAKFYVLNEFLKTNDFNFSSVFFYYKNGKFYAGPPWDYDLSMGNVNKDFSSNSAVAFKTDGEFINDKLFYKYLCKNEWFMLEVRREYARHSDYIKNIGSGGGLIDSLASEYADVFERNYTDAGWSIRYLINVMMYPLPTYEENLEFFKNWCVERDSWLSDFYEIDSLKYILGDCDGNKTIDVEDVTLLQKYLAETETDPEIALRGAVTGEKLSISDATEIQKYIAGIKTTAKTGQIEVK